MKSGWVSAIITLGTGVGGWVGGGITTDGVRSRRHHLGEGYRV